MSTHVENQLPAMVDISPKAPSIRLARARARVVFPADAVFSASDKEIFSAKGPVVATAVVAGIMAAKKTSSLIPLCHPVAIEDCQVRIERVSERVLLVECLAATTHKTGVEMEAMTGAAVAALTIYDMMKSVSKGIIIEDLRLVEKTGGKSDWRTEHTRDGA